jgi:CheY-like chemotaxis protein
VTQRILIVDDEPANVELLKAYLASVADDILGLTSSREAEPTFADFQPDLLLLDLHMPDPAGLRSCADCVARGRAWATSR